MYSVYLDEKIKEQEASGNKERIFKAVQIRSKQPRTHRDRYLFSADDHNNSDENNEIKKEARKVDLSPEDLALRHH